MRNLQLWWVNIHRNFMEISRNVCAIITNFKNSWRNFWINLFQKHTWTDLPVSKDAGDITVQGWLYQKFLRRFPLEKIWRDDEISASLSFSTLITSNSSARSLDVAFSPYEHRVLMSTNTLTKKATKTSTKMVPEENKENVTADTNRKNDHTKDESHVSLWNWLSRKERKWNADLS